MAYLFTSESVSEGHPDKVADQISDALLDEFLRIDPNSKVACETLVTTGLVVLSGEVHTLGYVDVQKVAREVIRKIGYTKAEYMFDADSCGVISAIHEQSGDIRQGVERQNLEEQGAGDQGMMFGYASNETDEYMPLPIELAHLLLQELSDIRREGKVMPYLRPDAKSQVTIEYGADRQPKSVHTIVVSTQHDEFASEKAMMEKIRNDIQSILIPRTIMRLPERVKPLFNDDMILHVNPTGKFVIGGPHGDTGLTGRKIIVDTYGGRGAHGGGAFSGKDSSKVDRSAAYAMRHIAKNMVAAGIADDVLVQVAYAIGVARPVGLYINTYGTSKTGMTDSEIANKINDIFDLRPFAIVNRFNLKNPVFLETAAYGHMGRPYRNDKVFVYENGNANGGKQIQKEADFFAWEKLDYVDTLRKEFKL
ncbi:MAG: methionine adenosyltransferase [Bacteroidales bacterium]|nr:methionine adenosyltransferase [Bacteroidales bacterium]MBN2762390.1 methionine adenosyltransferase [Bacteroidales bacterium]